MTEDLTAPLLRLLLLRSNVRLSGMTESSEALAELLNRLEMPASLLGGKRIASQACCLLRKSLRTLLVEERPKVREHIRELRWVISHAEKLAFLIFTKDERQLFLNCSGGNPYMRGGAGNHGLCCLLWERYSGQGPDTVDKLPSLHKPYDALRREALLTHITVIGYWVQHEVWLSPEGPVKIVRGSMYRRTLAIRHFTMGRYLGSPAYRNVLRCIPVFRPRPQLITALHCKLKY